MNRLTFYIALLLMASASALADLHFSHPLTPLKIGDISGFANGPSYDFRVSRKNFMGFLRHAKAWTTLPPSIQKRAEAGELLFREQGSELIYDLHGVFGDKLGHIYFWQAIGPRLLVVATEDGHGCYYFMNDEEPASFELRAVR